MGRRRETWGEGFSAEVKPVSGPWVEWLLWEKAVPTECVLTLCLTDAFSFRDCVGDPTQPWAWPLQSGRRGQGPVPSEPSGFLPSPFPSSGPAAALWLTRHRDLGLDPGS